MSARGERPSRSPPAGGRPASTPTRVLNDLQPASATTKKIIIITRPTEKEPKGNTNHTSYHTTCYQTDHDNTIVKLCADAR